MEETRHRGTIMDREGSAVFVWLGSRIVRVVRMRKEGREYTCQKVTTWLAHSSCLHDPFRRPHASPTATLPYSLRIVNGCHQNIVRLAVQP